MRFSPAFRLLIFSFLLFTFSPQGHAAIDTSFPKQEVLSKKSTLKSKKKTKNGAFSKEKWGWASIGLFTLSFALTPLSIFALLGVFGSTILGVVSYRKDEKRGAFTVALILHALFYLPILYVLIFGIPLSGGPILTF